MPPHPCFVIGTGRCGSTLVSNIMKAHPGILSLSEMFTVLGRRRAFTRSTMTGSEFWAFLMEPQYEMTRFAELGLTIPEILYRPTPVEPSLEQGVAPLRLVPLPHLSDGYREYEQDLRRHIVEIPRLPLRELYHTLFSWLAGRMGKDLWVERSGGSLAYVDRILDLWPDARIIHIVRDGEPSAWSMSKHPFFRAIVGSLVARRSNQLASEFDPDCALQQIDIKEFGLYWSQQVRFGLRELDRRPTESVLHVRYESLLVRPKETINAIIFFITERRADADWVDRVSDQVHAAHSQPPPPQVFQTLARACTPGRRLLEAKGIMPGLQ